MNAPGVITSFSSYNSMHEGKSLGAGGRYFIYDSYSVPIYTQLGLKGRRESLIAGSYAIFWLHCPRWTTGGCRGGNDEIALASKNVASILYHSD